ncbi:MAG: type I DNA topoisomerase [Gammaproteobacteria bacterium]|nr:type I DNA topoisomerase [Gammaproteobacteria bacterium]
MGKSLVIVESPNKASTIKKYLGKDFIVKSSKGHIRDLKKGQFISLKQLREIVADAGKTDSAQKLVEVIGVDPYRDWQAKYEIVDGKRQVVNDLQKAASDSHLVYLATDMDREGEAIAWHLQEVLGGDPDRFRRVVFNEITKNAITSAFAAPDHVNMDRVRAQQARRFLDRVVGFELTPLLIAKVANRLSGGRVQSVAVRLVVEREREIRAFDVREYWELFAYLTRLGKQDQTVTDTEPATYKFQVVKYRGEDCSLETKEEAEALVSELSKTTFIVDSFEKKPTKSSPSPPFTTSTLQQAASTRLGFNVRKTMRLAQNLYEAGYISYMRTDSTNLSEEAVSNARSFLQSHYEDKYVPASPNRYQTKARAAQEAHEAIRPTDVRFTPQELQAKDNDQRRLYELIWRRFVACQMTPAEYLSVTTRVKANDFQLIIRGRVVVFDGFTRVYPSTSKGDETQELPEFQVGEELLRHSLEKKQRFTKPPARYSEASLVRELEKRGIGRPSTYVPIITTIQERGYVSLRNKRFSAERIGEIVTDRLKENFQNLMEYEFTADMEKELDRISLGEKQWRDVLNGYYDDFAQRFVRAADFETGMRKNNPIESDILCPECQRKLMIRTASSGVFLGCSGYSLPKDQRCEQTLSLTPIVQKRVQVDEETEGRELKQKTRCESCATPMNEYLIDESRKLFVCANPDCQGFKLEVGTYEIAGYDGPIVECDKCAANMQLKEGRFGKYFACTNQKCANTRKLMRGGKVAPPKADPIDMPELRCDGIDDHFVLRDGASGLFLAASKFPKHRQTRAPLVRELLPHANELDPKFKYLLEAPTEDPEGNPTMVRYSRKLEQQYVRSEDGAKKWSAFYKDGVWIAEPPPKVEGLESKS